MIWRNDRAAPGIVARTAAGKLGGGRVGLGLRANGGLGGTDRHDSIYCLDIRRRRDHCHDSKHCHDRRREVRRDDLLQRVRDRKPGEDISPRLLRYLIAEGVIEPPRGPDNAAEYTDRHVVQFCSYFDLKEQGYSLRQISALRSASDAVISPDAARDDSGRFLGGGLPPVRVSPGVYLSIAPRELSEPVDPDAIAEQVRAFLESVLIRRSDPDVH